MLASLLGLAGLTALVAFATLPSGKTAEAAPVTIEIALTGSQENPPVAGPGSGFARLTFDEATKKLTFAVTVSGISGDQVTAAHIHRGAVGVNGPIVYNLSTVPFTTVDGEITLTDADIADLKAGNFYVNVHSTTNPGGFARGQIFLTAEPGIRASVARTVAAWNAKDITAFLNGFTPEGAINEFDSEDIQEVIEGLPEFIGDPPITAFALSKVVQTSSTSATGILDLTLGRVIERHDYAFELVGGTWKIAGGEIIPYPLPAGTTNVPVSLQEFAFVYDKASITSGNVAFSVKNTGKQFHELALAKIPAGPPLQQILASDDEDIPGFEFIGAVFAAPGESTSMVFAQPLAAGRYAMVCFVPDEATGTPHAFLGMASEFTVGATSGGGAVRPPSTGDGGLVGESHSHDALLAVGILGLLSAGALAFSARGARVKA
jgi:hypothetical protein